MVGVPGKYKGCETCRKRRVKCSNERPFCRTCVASGRTCDGYERERVFITGTPESKGRVASHPKKNTPPRKPKASPSPSIKVEEAEKPRLSPQPPLTSAWDDYTSLSGPSGEFPVLITALQTNLQSIVKQDTGGDDVLTTSQFNMHFTPYAASELLPDVGNAFGMNAQCFVRQKATNAEQDSTESYCAFLYEYDSSGVSWKLTAEQMITLGPHYFVSFPNHHFFVRVYRPVAMSIALLSRRDTFLRLPEWTRIPWEQHPKSLLDRLFDTILQIPALLAETDHILPMQATLSRRSQAEELLHNCLIVEGQFRQWLEELYKGTEEGQFPFWPEDLRTPGGAIPFANAYAFKDALTSIMFLYYWMAMIPFHRCIENLHMAIFQPVIDAYPNIWPDLPPSLQIDPTHYQDGREQAANICRGLDAALDATVQPEILLAPMTMAADFYRVINTTSQDGVLEILWLDGFKRRLWAKAQAVSNVLQGHNWVEIANF